MSVCVYLAEGGTCPLILLLWPRGVVSREHLPDLYLFLGPKEKDSLLSGSLELQVPNGMLTQRITEWRRTKIQSGQGNQRTEERRKQEMTRSTTIIRGLG